MVRRGRLVDGGDEFRTFFAPKGEKQLRSNTLAAFWGVPSKWLLLSKTPNEKGFENAPEKIV